MQTQRTKTIGRRKRANLMTFASRVVLFITEENGRKTQSYMRFALLKFKLLPQV